MYVLRKNRSVRRTNFVRVNRLLATVEKRNAHATVVNSNSAGFHSHYSPRGWVQWPDNEDYSLQFMRVLGCAQEGASAISECFLTASHIATGDDESWYREWKDIADINKTRGDSALARGHIHTALSNWLRASNYYRSAGAFLEWGDRRRKSVLGDMQKCSHLYIERLAPSGEIVRIPCFEGNFIEAYFLRAPGSRRRMPVVICVGGPGHFKDDHLYRLQRQAHIRGLSLLLVDLPGEGTTPRNKVAVQYEIETAISSCVDYLISRSDVDDKKIVVLGDGLGASFASRAAAADDRFAAAVCDAGIWDLHRHALMTGRIAHDGQSPEDETQRLWHHDLGGRIGCPVLVTLGEHDWLDVRHATALCRSREAAKLNITLKVFSSAETAASHAHIDNPTFGNEYVFDWISTCLDAA